VRGVGHRGGHRDDFCCDGSPHGILWSLTDLRLTVSAQTRCDCQDAPDIFQHWAEITVTTERAVRTVRHRPRSRRKPSIKRGALNSTVPASRWRSDKGYYPSGGAAQTPCWGLNRNKEACDLEQSASQSVAVWLARLPLAPRFSFMAVRGAAGETSMRIIFAREAIRMAGRYPSSAGPSEGFASRSRCRARRTKCAPQPCGRG
jgi:hypothetical protein